MSTVNASTRRFTRIVYTVSVAPAASLIGYICYVKWKLHRSTHRPFVTDDMYYIRTMSGNVPSFDDNPGVRIERDFLSEREQEKLRFESKVMLSLYGYSTVPFWSRPNWNKQISGLLAKTRVNAIKVTGRDTQVAEPPMTDHAKELRAEQEAALIKTKPYETNQPTKAPWNTAHNFDFDKLPKVFRELVEKIRELPGYKLGSIRDFSIDYRDDSYFKFDPHKTPGLDGVTVFMLTLESDGVVTLVPPDKEVYRRSTVQDINKQSYTDQDLDILHKRGDLLCLTDRAREKMEWSIRLGIDAKTKGLKQIVKRKYTSRDMEQANDGNQENTQQMKYDVNDVDDELVGAQVVGNEDVVRRIVTNGNENEYMLCDWWGTPRHLVPRNKEKILITVTFARPT